jgi:dTDP-4-dehydrorhamnose 3,5-epimerase
MIDGVITKELNVRSDERGRLMEIIRKDDQLFLKFGQVYMTTAYPGVVKGWHYHRKQIDNFAVVKGMIKLVLYDNRDDSPTKGEINEFFLGEHSPLLVQIPSLVLHGFKCISQEEAICVNCPTEAFDYQQPDEFKLDPHKNDVPYSWERKDG